MKKGSLTISQLALMVLALAVLAVSLWIVFSNSAKANESVNALTGCADGVIASSLGEESRCFVNNTCGEPVEGKKWQSLGKFGCTEEKSYCCVLMDEEDVLPNKTADSKDEPSETANDEVPTCSPESYPGCEGRAADEPFLYTNTFGTKCVVCEIKGDNDYCGEPLPNSGC